MAPETYFFNGCQGKGDRHLSPVSLVLDPVLLEFLAQRRPMQPQLAGNTYVEYVHSDGKSYDVDHNSLQEGKSTTQPTYAVTSRSYHLGVVNTCLMDGSVRSIGETIDLTVWRALGTRGAGEVVSSEF